MSTAPALSSPAAKKRRTSVTQLSSGLENVMGSTADKTRAYIAKGLEGEANDELASLIADMLRDGDLHNALERRKKTSQVRLVGALVPVSKRGKSCWKQLGRRFDRTCIEFCIGKELFDKDESSLKLMSASRASQPKLFALNQAAATELPKDHKPSEYENALLHIAGIRYKEMGKRLAGISKDNMHAYVHFSWEASEKRTIRTKALGGVTITVPFSDAELDEQTDWKVSFAWSLKEASFGSLAAGNNRTILPLLVKQHPMVPIIDEDLKFEMPQATNHFELSAASSSSVAASAGAPSNVIVAAATPGLVADAGIVAVQRDAPPPLES